MSSFTGLFLLCFLVSKGWHEILTVKKSYQQANVDKSDDKKHIK